ncbi:MAG: type I phosphomannose isomerase catalytic subunit [Planctomycetota bacterium]|nr:type I phosphomannose isomerase catalytic subunit [Planctomycetota bacterium]
MSVYPYKFEPVYKEKIWGGRALERLFGRALPAGAKIGESWELADLPEGQSVVSGGPDFGKTLGSLLAEKADEILGHDIAPDDGRFPLLLKLLDANDILSLQVHPDEQSAAELGPPAKFKTECWYILESRGGYILKGVRPGVTEADFRKAIAAEAEGWENAFDDLLVRFDVCAGDFHYLPAGTVHALGPGVVVAEIQTPSYTTYRVSDWGRGREVHVAEALKCIHFEPGPDSPPGAGGDVLVSTPWFAVRRLVIPAGERQTDAGECKAWMALAGKGQITCGELDKPVSIFTGDTILLPAGIKEPSLAAEEQMTLLEITIPKTKS